MWGEFAIMKISILIISHHKFLQFYLFFVFCLLWSLLPSNALLLPIPPTKRNEPLIGYPSTDGIVFGKMPEANGNATFTIMGISNLPENSGVLKEIGPMLQIIRNGSLIVYAGRKDVAFGSISEDENITITGSSKLPGNSNKEFQLLEVKEIDGKRVSLCTNERCSICANGIIGAECSPVEIKWWENENTITRYLIFALATSVILLMIFGIGYYLLRKYYLTKKIKHSDYYAPNNSYAPAPDMPSELQCKGTIDIKQLEFADEKIGEGNSSNVYFGRFFQNPANLYDVIEVAVKIAKGVSIANDQDIEKEIAMMKNCDHKNIVKFIGWVYTDQYYIITEYLHGGNLLGYLRDPQNQLTVEKGFHFIDQILEGMLYLSRNHIMHRDLAARNCLLNVDYSLIKISDFGLSRKTDVNYEYAVLQSDRHLPVRWLPVETLFENCFGSTTDIWSFATVIWEIFERGAVPYAELNFEGIKRFLKKGKRLPRPNYCPEALYVIMLSCWDVNPKKRPSFQQLSISIKRIPKTFEYHHEYEQPIISNRFTGPNNAIVN